MVCVVEVDVVVVAVHNGKTDRSDKIRDIVDSAERQAVGLPMGEEIHCDIPGEDGVIYIVAGNGSRSCLYYLLGGDINQEPQASVLANNNTQALPRPLHCNADN